MNENLKEQFNFDIPKSKFSFVNTDKSVHDKKFDTKPIGFFKDAMMRFSKNKSSVVAFYIILLLLLYAIIVPFVFKTNYNTSIKDNDYLKYQKLLPKAKGFEWLGMDGCKNAVLTPNEFARKQALFTETGMEAVKSYTKNVTDEGTSYLCYLDTYADLGMDFLSLGKEEFDKMQRWQDETGIQVLYPVCDYNKLDVKVEKEKVRTDPNIWYTVKQVNRKNVPLYSVNEDGSYTFTNIYATSNGRDNYTSLRIEGDDAIVKYQYATIGGSATLDSEGNLQYDGDGYIIGDIKYDVRVSKIGYFQYKYGFVPSFIFGTNSVGQDIFYRLAQGARFSFILAISVSIINLLIGAIYGAIEGYYGGATDMIMERFVEILGGIPFIVVTTLFQLHLAKSVGVIGALLFAFVATGWIGMSGTVRMQFYRFKNQEYILAARTLGAKDRRIMFKHIFPNALGTIVTSCVLVIPGVIFSESSLTYLGIINLESDPRFTSVGTMLALGKDFLQTHPHIILFPALFISLLEISFNLFGNGLRDAFNPSLRGSEE